MDLKGKAAASVEGVLGDIAEDGPGCAIGVVAGGETLAANAKGLASLEHSAPLTPASRFYLASVSKQVTALAVLLAEQSAQLELDGSIRAVIPELPPFMDGVTFR